MTFTRRENTRSDQKKVRHRVLRENFQRPRQTKVEELHHSPSKPKIPNVPKYNHSIDASCCLLTFGLYTPFWIGSNLQDLLDHSHKAIYSKYQLFWVYVSFVPILSIISLYKLAKVVREIERQNCYEKISPPLAGLLAAFPPLSTYYIQHAIDRHYLMHQKYHPESLTNTKLPE